MHFCLIDLQRDFFEEISNDDETHRLTGNNGCASEKLYQLCDATVAPEYRDLVRRFMDVPTLAERLKNEEYISTEYRMCDGSWHSLRFIAKKRDEAGNVTHVLCTVRCRSVWKVRTRLFRRDLYGYYDAPRMNGWDAARTIRAMNRPDAEIIPIIAMSANAFSEDIMDSRLAGMDIHLAKPLDEAKMIKALKQCIAERSAVKLRNDL